MILKKIIFLVVFICCNQLYSQRFALDTIESSEVVVVAEKKCSKNFSKALYDSKLRSKSQKIRIKGNKIFKNNPENPVKIKVTGDIHKRFLSKKIELKNVTLNSITGDSIRFDLQKIKHEAKRLVKASYPFWATVTNSILLKKFYFCQSLPNHQWLFTATEGSKEIAHRKEDTNFRDEGSLRIYTKLSAHGRLMTIEMKALSLYEKDDKDFIFKYIYQPVKNGIELMKARGKIINREDHSTTRLTIEF